MKRVGALFALLSAGLSGVACSDDGGGDAAPASSSAPVTSVAEPAATSCFSAAQDDDGFAQTALLADAHLPPGDWTRETRPACRWSFASADLLQIDACVDLAGPTLLDARTGNAKATWRDDTTGMRLDSQFELYPSATTPSAFALVLGDDSFDGCIAAALAAQAQGAPAVEITDVEIDEAAGRSASSLQMDSVDGVTVAMTVGSGDDAERVSIRAITLRVGGVLGTVVVTATGSDGSEAIDRLDWDATVRAAAQDMLAAF
jgi:hypothetical protein